MPDELDAANVETLTNAQRDALVTRLKAAWNNLPADRQEALKPLLDAGHGQFANFVQNGVHPEPAMRPLLRIKSYLTDDWDGHLDNLGQPLNQAQAQPLAAPLRPAAIEIKVASNGQILGTGKYQELDPRWELVAGTVWLENLLHKHPFPQGVPGILPMPDRVRIVLVSDFGTGNFGAQDSPSTRIAHFIPSLRPDYTIHLGDVYYAGTNAEEVSNFIVTWPTGSRGSFTLNSNHEMYSGGGPYFNKAVGGPVFNPPGKPSQSPFSFFALENDHWILVGLDSAYYADVLHLYLQGTLGSGNAQIAFLEDIARRGKRVIVLTHHNGLPIGGDPTKSNPPVAPLKLYTDVMAAFNGQPAPAYWYYGHEHIGVAYAPLDNGTRCRCLGHGALPWGFSTDLDTAQKAARVEWFEGCNAGDPSDRLRVYNGFVCLDLDGPNLIETFYDETGRAAWQPGTADTR